VSGRTQVCLTPCQTDRYNLIMSKPLSKKGAERRKKARGPARVAKKSPKREKTETVSRARRQELNQQGENCQFCSKNLHHEEKALFVEEEVGRIFCSEDCIASFFSPEVERLEKEYLRFVSNGDLTGDEREKLAHLRWITLQEPDEVWRQKTLSGDYRFTLISEFQPANRPIWCVCVCLFLRGEPSFLYIAFPTKNTAMVNHYRRGERVEWVKPSAEGEISETKAVSPTAAASGQGQGPIMMDGLADAWTEEETLRAQMSQHRRTDDIPEREYELYQTCLEETLETPDEVWSLLTGESADEVRLYHFIRHYADEAPGVWYVIVARETEDDEQIEILDAFPTRDRTLVDRYRQGEQELGNPEPVKTSNRMVH
jgi:hypothetical protein